MKRRCRCIRICPWTMGYAVMRHRGSEPPVDNHYDQAREGRTSDLFDCPSSSLWWPSPCWAMTLGRDRGERPCSGSRWTPPSARRWSGQPSDPAGCSVDGEAAGSQDDLAIWPGTQSFIDNDCNGCVSCLHARFLQVFAGDEGHLDDVTGER